MAGGRGYRRSPCDLLWLHHTHARPVNRLFLGHDLSKLGFHGTGWHTLVAVTQGLAVTLHLALHDDVKSVRWRRLRVDHLIHLIGVVRHGLANSQHHLVRKAAHNLADIPHHACQFADISVGALAWRGRSCNVGTSVQGPCGSTKILDGHLVVRLANAEQCASLQGTASGGSFACFLLQTPLAKGDALSRSGHHLLLSSPRRHEHTHAASQHQVESIRRFPKTEHISPLLHNPKGRRAHDILQQPHVQRAERLNLGHKNHQLANILFRASGGLLVE
mmetsp:Transcript_54532/g.125163  ORF Transcript_54532/g.125163 Transcript_54532/m.125163 type:complete len:276 (+) Transcript_54532:3590-4417(+)